MTEVEFQKKVLEKLKNMEEGQSRLEEGQSRLEEGQSRLELKQSHFELKQSHFEENQLRFEKNLSRLETKIDHLASEGQKDINAMLQLMNSKLDATATKEDLARIEDVLDVLAARTTRQEADILNLKRAK